MTWPCLPGAPSGQHWEVKRHATNRSNALDDLTDAQVNKRLRYALFKSVCRILEAGRSKEELKRLRGQRTALEKRLGYDVLRGKS